MATKLFYRDAASDIDPTANIDKLLSLSQGSASVSKVTTCVTGPTAGVQVTDGGGGTAIEWYSNPLTAVTISGTVTFNVWATESSTAANVGMQVIVERCDGSGSVLSTISNSEHGTEVTGGLLVRNWTATPTSTTLSNGDRLRVRIMGNDAGGNMGGSGRNFTVAYGAGTGVSGDSYVQFNESITEYSAGTEYTQDVSGTCGSLSGTLAKITQKALAGTQGAVSGTIAKLTNKPLSGAAGAVTGAITKLANKSLSGIAGELTGVVTGLKTMYASLAGSVGDLTGAISKETNKALGGVFTGTGAITKATLKSLTGTMGALAGELTGEIVGVILVTLEGAISGTGTLVKATTRTVNGAMGGLVGAVSAAATYVKSFAGSIDGIGILTKTTNKALTGTTGALTGVVTSSRIYFKALAGAVGGLTGTIAKVTQRQLSGMPALTGSVTKRLARSLAGSISSLTGVMTYRQIVRRAIIKGGKAISKIQAAGKASAFRITGGLRRRR